MVPKFSYFFDGWIWQFLFESSKNCSNSGKVISKNDLESKQSYSDQEFLI